jgi:hypothetical protein
LCAVSYFLIRFLSQPTRKDDPAAERARHAVQRQVDSINRGFEIGFNFDRLPRVPGQVGDLDTHTHTHTHSHTHARARATASTTTNHHHCPPCHLDGLAQLSLTFGLPHPHCNGSPTSSQRALRCLGDQMTTRVKRCVLRHRENSRKPLCCHLHTLDDLAQTCGVLNRLSTRVHGKRCLC